MEKNNTQKGIVQFAMEAGAYMGLYFVVKFIFAVLSLNYPFDQHGNAYCVQALHVPTFGRHFV